MSARALLAPLLAVLAVAFAAPAESRAAETAESARAKGKRLVVSPRPGRVVHSHHVWLRVRSRTLDDTLRVRLNESQIGADFGPPRGATRTLRASLSHGLRHGRNVLRVTVRRPGRAPRRATVRFAVRTKRPLVGAGRDRQVAIDGRVQVRGRLKRATSGGDGAQLRWKLVRSPRRGGIRAVRAQAATEPARLTSPAGSIAEFRPPAPGRYTLRLTAAAGGPATSDKTSVEALPQNLLVPIETMTATTADKRDQRGIRVGDTTYQLRDAEGGNAESYLQVLTLKRRTLEFLSNRRYASAAALGADLDPDKPDPSKLVILVLQPLGSDSVRYDGLENVVGRIGVPDQGASLPKTTGTISAIGVPGMDAGDADVNIVGSGSGRLGSMKGYLVRDQYKNFGFAASGRVPFTFAPTPKDPCASQDLDCLNHAGFRVRNLDSRTGAPGPKDGQFYATGSYRCQSGIPISECSNREALRMAEDLEAIENENVVMIEAVSARGPSGGYLAPIANGVHPDNMVRLANDIAGLGGTRNGFNRIARNEGAIAGGGLTYALVGWKGAQEGAGAEIAAGADGAGEAPALTGILRPDRQSRFRPAATDTGPDALSELVLDDPTHTWPLSKDCRSPGMANDEPDANAIAYLGQANGLGPDPRATYALQPNTQAEWERIAGKVEQTQYPGGRIITEAQFLAARCQLAKELGWVGSVRGYLEKLKKPIAKAAAGAYPDIVEIGDRIFEAADKPEDGGAFFVVEFMEIFLELAGPATHEVSAAIAGLMNLGVTAFEAGENGAPADRVQFKARELGDELVKEMQQTVGTFDAIGDVVVSDSAKLAFVGAHGGCVPTDPSCPKGYSFTGDDETRVYADVYRSLERLSYETLLPIGFDTLRLNRQTLDRTPDLRWEYCFGLDHPFWYYSATAVSTASAAELLAINPARPGDKLWQLLVLSRPPKSGYELWRTPPTDEILKRMFDPVPDSDKPTEGGLGIQPAVFMRATKQRDYSHDCS
jgi:hypothetical protein